MFRKFYATLCFLIVSMIMSVSAFASDSIVWRIQTVAPAGSNEFKWLDEEFANNVKAMSGGRLTIEIHAAGTLMKSSEVPEAVSRGILDMGHTYLSYFGGRERGLDAASEWVGDGHPLQGVMWFYDDEGASIMRPITARHNIYYLGVSPFLGEHIWSKKPLNSLEDLKGLKIRAQALAGETFDVLGASTVTIPGEEVYPSLQRGMVDAAEYIDDIVNYGQGLHEVTKYVIFPSYSGGGTVDWIVNMNSWNKLPDDLKVIVDLALRTTNFNFWNKAIVGELDVQRKVLDYGNEFITWSAEDMAKLAQVRLALMRDKASKNEDYKRRLESQLKFLEKIGYIIPE